MRNLRPFPALIALAVIGAACSSSSPGASTGADQSQAGGASQGGAASEPAASTGGGGGGGGNGAYGSLHYEITGDVTKSGDLDFTYINGGISIFANGGWVAYFYSQDQNTVIQINSTPGSGIFNYGDGEFLIIGTEPDTNCTFDFSKNDASGLKGTIDCENAISMNATSGATLHTKVRATVDAHT